MIVLLIILSLFAIVFILFYDKKGSIKELERYYQTHNDSPEKANSNEPPERKKF